MSNSVKFDTDVVQLILKGVEDSEDAFKEEMASVTKNPMVTWAKFILTDDKPNKNKMIVPQSEFDNIIKSGINMPIKMAFNNIEEDHEYAFPIGVITNLKKIKNQIVGLAAFWTKERPEDIDMLKDMYSSDKQINLSWELLAEEVELETGEIEVRNASLRAATIVGAPAYAGRTPILALASEYKKQEDKILDELEKLQKELQDVKDERDSFKSQVSELQSSVDELKELKTEVETLREFKQEVDAAKEKEEKLASLKLKFSEAGIEKEENYFETNEEMLLSLNDEALGFMLQELVAFGAKEQTASEKKPKEKAPNFQSGDGNEGDELSMSELAGGLLARK